MTRDGASPGDEQVEIGPTDSFDIRGPRRGLLRPMLRFQLTYDFLRLPNGGVLSWQNISDLQLAPDGETLLVWVFAQPSERGERSESDPVRDEPVAVSLRGWPYPPDEIVATLVAQFEKYLAEVAVDDASADDAPADEAEPPVAPSRPLRPRPANSADPRPPARVCSAGSGRRRDATP